MALPQEAPCLGCVVVAEKTENKGMLEFEDQARARALAGAVASEQANGDRRATLINLNEVIFCKRRTCF